MDLFIIAFKFEKYSRGFLLSKLVNDMRVKTGLFAGKRGKIIVEVFKVFLLVAACQSVVGSHKLTENENFYLTKQNFLG